MNELIDMIKRVGHDEKSLFYINKTFKKNEERKVEGSTASEESNLHLSLKVSHLLAQTSHLLVWAFCLILLD